MDGSLTFLGTGTSMGVPTVGCGCAVCTSSDPRDRRLRPSVMVRWCDFGGRQRTVVIDTGPDFREQALRAGLNRLDAVFYTHAHADHIFGLDDLRPLSFAVQRENGGVIPLYAAPETAEVLERVYEYTFSPDATYPTRARVRLERLEERTTVYGVEFVRIPVRHGALEIAGFRFGNAAYFTDVSEIPESSFQMLKGVDVVVLSALRHKPHPSHATLEQAVDWAKRIDARQTWLTHIAHDLGHDATNRTLPENIQLAFDGLSVPVQL